MSGDVCVGGKLGVGFSAAEDGLLDEKLRRKFAELVRRVECVSLRLCEVGDAVRREMEKAAVAETRKGN